MIIACFRLRLLGLQRRALVIAGIALWEGEGKLMGERITEREQSSREAGMSDGGSRLLQRH